MIRPGAAAAAVAPVPVRLLRCLLLGLALGGASAAEPPESTVILRDNQLTAASLSPDGRFVAAAFTLGHTSRVEVTPIDAPADRQVAYLGAPPNPRIIDLVWAGDGTLVLGTEDWVIAAVRPGQDIVAVIADPASLEDSFSVPQLQVRDAGSSVQTDQTTDERLPRVPRLLGPDPGNPHAVLIETVSGNALDNADIRTHAVDTRSGEVTQLDWRRINHGDTSFLSDPAGRLRLITERVGEAFTCRVRVDRGGELGRWVEIDRVLPPEWATSFAFTRRTAHRHRSLPLAFGPDANRLVFASNLPAGRWSLFEVELGSDTPPQPCLQLADAHSLHPPAYSAPRPYGRLEQRLREVLPGMVMTDFAPHRFPRALVPPVDPDGPAIMLETRGDPSDPVWQTPEWAELSDRIARGFPGRQPVVLDWSADHQRWLLRLESEERPGRIFVHDLAGDRWIEYYRSGTSPTWEERNRVETVTLTADGRPFRARVTHPHAPRVSRPPVVCLFADEPWERPFPAFTPVAHYFADAGAIVLELEPPLALRADDGAAPPPDVLTAARVEVALDWLAREQQVHLGRMATVGWGFGGWLGLRVPQLLPDRFDAAVALNHSNRLWEQFYPPRFNPRGLRVNRPAEETVATATALVDALKQQGEELLLSGGGGNSNPLEVPYPRGDFTGQPDDDENDGTSREFQRPSLLVSAITQRAMTGARTLRALEVSPLQPLLLQQSLDHVPADQLKDSLVEDARLLPPNVLLGAEKENPYLHGNPAGALTRALKRADKNVEHWLIEESSWSRPLDERADVWHHVATYLAANLYHYDVRFGPTQRVP